MISRSCRPPWGFPTTYNWEEMARDGFAWWKRVSARWPIISALTAATMACWDSSRIWQIPMDAVHRLLDTFNHGDSLSHRQAAPQTTTSGLIWILQRPDRLSAISPSTVPLEITAKAPAKRFRMKLSYGRLICVPVYTKRKFGRKLLCRRDKNSRTNRVCSILTPIR